MSSPSQPTTTSPGATRDAPGSSARLAQRWLAVHRAQLVGALLVASVLLLYAPTLEHQFLSYVDPTYVTANLEVLGGLSVENLQWALTNTSGSSWHPITWLSHMLDIELHGEKSGRHHATSALLHALNVLLLFVALRRMTGATLRSGLAAALFAVHPLHAESVAWVSARKDLLSGLFALLAINAHVAYAKGRRPVMGFAVMASFALGLAAKPVLVTLPFALLLLDRWPLGRLQESLAELVREKALLFGLALTSCVVTLAVLSLGSSGEDLSDVAVGQRAANALVSYARYLGKLAWPHDLAILYPHPQAAGGVPWAGWQVAGSALLLTGISAAAITLRERAPYLLMGWAWFVVMLLPVIGVVQIGSQAMADGFVYLPALGLYVALAWGAVDLGSRSRASRAAVGAVACAGLAALAIATGSHLRHFASSEALWQRTADIRPHSWIAYNELGNLRYAQGRVAEAIVAYRRAVALEPDEPSLYNDLAWVLSTTADPELRDGEEALRLAQHASRATSYGDAGYLDTLAAAYASVGRYEAATTWAERGVEIAQENGEEILALIIRDHAARFRDGNPLHP